MLCLTVTLQGLLFGITCVLWFACLLSVVLFALIRVVWLVFYFDDAALSFSWCSLWFDSTVNCLRVVANRWNLCYLLFRVWLLLGVVRLFIWFVGYWFVYLSDCWVYLTYLIWVFGVSHQGVCCLLWAFVCWFFLCWLVIVLLCYCVVWFVALLTDCCLWFV